MKKVFVFIMGGLILCSAFAAGENTPTSKSYVDAAVAQKQDKISANIIMPAGYTRLEYIESTGTQWIDTQQKFMYGDEFYFEYMPMASYSGENKGYGAGANLDVNITGGGRNSNSRVCMYDFRGNLCYEPQLLYDYTLGRRYVENWTLKSGVFHSVLTDVNDGSTYTISRGSISQSYDSGDTVYLWRDHSPTYSFPSKSRIYRTWLKRADGTMAFDLFPARRDSDGVLGMYDMGTNTFFTNNGTGEFIAGPVIPGNQVLTNTGTAGEYGTRGIYDANGEYAAQQNNLVDAVTMNTAVQNAIDSEFQCIEWDDHGECLLMQLGGITQVPTGYTPLQYLESTGTQWIDTGIYINYDYEIFAILDPLSTGGFYYWGAAGNNSSDRTAWYTFWSVNSSGPSTWGGSRNTFYYRNLVPNSKNTVVQNKNGIWVNGTKTTSFSPVFDSRQAELTLYIFKTNPVSFDWNSGRIKLYELHVKNGNGRIVQNLVPARRDSDSILGMYDTVTGTFFTNAGTGEFVAGPVLNLYLPSGN